MLTVEDAIRILSALPAEDKKKVLCYSQGTSPVVFAFSKIETANEVTVSPPAGGWIHNQSVIIAY